jgi:hypothetical protein
LSSAALAGCQVNFRVRNPDSDDASVIQESYKAYRLHLSRFKETSGNDLWKFFYWDFFHDGVVQSVQVQGDLRTVVIGLDCPNIKRLKPDGRYEYVNVGFTCTFHTVATFSMQFDPPEHSWDARRNSVVFLYSEINTSPVLESFELEDEYGNPEPHYSLLIQLLADESVVWLEMVFSQVDVIANEPAAFALMESDSQFEAPTWSADKMSKDDLRQVDE